MIIKALKYNKNRSGSAIAFVILLFTIAMIIFISVNFLFSSNLSMATNQEENMRGYYLALAGIDVTRSTLISRLYVDSNGKEKTMFQWIRDNYTDPLRDEIDIEGEVVSITVTYDKNEDVIIIDSSVSLESGKTKKLTLRMELSGNQYKERWSR